MSPRPIALASGLITLALGLAGLVYPDRVMGFLGYGIQNPAHSAAVLGEVRATYGGIFVVLGVYTLAAGVNPFASRGRLVLLGLVWLGASAGRLFSVSVDGNPGLPGWVSAVFEVVMGVALLVAAQGAAPPETVAQAEAPTAVAR